MKNIVSWMLILLLWLIVFDLRLNNLRLRLIDRVVLMSSPKQRVMQRAHRHIHERGDDEAQKKKRCLRGKNFDEGVISSFFQSVIVVFLFIGKQTLWMLVSLFFFFFSFSFFFGSSNLEFSTAITNASRVRGKMKNPTEKCSRQKLFGKKKSSKFITSTSHSE